MLAINIKSDLGNKLPRYLNSLFEKFHVFLGAYFYNLFISLQHGLEVLQ